MIIFQTVRLVHRITLTILHQKGTGAGKNNEKSERIFNWKNSGVGFEKLTLISVTKIEKRSRNAELPHSNAN